MRHLWRAILGLPPELHVDMERVNVEECRLRRLQLDLDMDERSARCIANVRRRMVEGTACDIPPMYGRREWYAARRRKRRLERARARVMLLFPEKKAEGGNQ